MLEKEYTDEELEELDGYLNDEWNHNIYEELCGEEYNDYEDLFEPLEFFHLIYSQIEFVKANKAKPLFVARNLKKLSFTDKQLDFLYSKIESYFYKKREDDKQLNVCCKEIDKLRNNLDVDDEDEEIEVQTPRPYDFKAVLAHLETLETLREKVAYLIEQRVSYQQSTQKSFDFDNPNFADKCNLEIEKLEKLARLKSIPQKTEQKTVEVAKNKDLTVDRTIFLLNRLIPSFSDCDATKKAEFINFLTGFDYETIRQRFSSIHKKDYEKPQAFKKDMEIVCKYLEILGLTNVISEIKKDLDFK